MIRLALAVVLALAFLPPAFAGQAADNGIANFVKYDYLREQTNHNDAPEIDRFLDYCGVPRGNPWCAAGLVYIYAEGNGWNRVLPRIARVCDLLKHCQRNSARYEVFRNRDILKGAYKKKRGDLLVWLYGNGPNPNGHIGAIVNDAGDWVVYNSIECNTVPGDLGNQRGEGGSGDPLGGVYYRKRSWRNVAYIIRLKG